MFNDISCWKKSSNAWLGEDDTFVGLIDLALGIVAALRDQYPAGFSKNFREDVRGLEPDEAAIAILNSVIKCLENRNIILVMENMDRAFSGLGESGQKKWRAFLQETSRIATLATSQQLFDGVSSRDGAFFGFFDIHLMKPLSVDDARALIRKIGIEQNEHDLVMFLDSPDGRFRIRALHHLAGGNHRMYVMLSEFLTKESLEDLVEAFEKLAEELTPYFQERIRSLPPQQAKLVQALSNADGAMTVKNIAEETFIPERSCSKQPGSLRDKGYVQSQKRGKESYYELAEPLMRLCLEVKNQRGKPLRPVTQFLKVWFPETSVEPESETKNSLSRVEQYRIAAVATPSIFHDDVSQKLTDETGTLLSVNCYKNAFELIQELKCADLIRNPIGPCLNCLWKFEQSCEN